MRKDGEIRVDVLSGTGQAARVRVAGMREEFQPKARRRQYSGQAVRANNTQDWHREAYTLIRQTGDQTPSLTPRSRLESEKRLGRSSRCLNRRSGSGDQSATRSLTSTAKSRTPLQRRTTGGMFFAKWIAASP
jgi:hypothetical protein